MEALQPGDPERIGSYLLQARLGTGGMGQVYLGRSPGGMPVALKGAQGGATGPAGDVFSLGAVLCYAATGDSPFGTAAYAPYAQGGGAQGIGWLPPAVASTIAYRASLSLPQLAAATTMPGRKKRPLGRRALLIGGAATAATLALGGTAAALWAGRPRSPILWTFDVPDVLGVGPLVAGDTVYVTGNETFALDPRTGKQRWSHATKISRSSRPVALGGMVFIYDGGTLDAFDAATGRFLWSEPVKTFAPSPVPAVSNGVACMTASPDTGQYVLYAIDIATGERRWQYEAERLLMTNAAAHNGVFYLGSGEELLYAVDAGGQLRWQQPVGDKVTSTPAVAGNLVYVTTQGYEVHAFDTATRRRRWRNATGAVAGGGADPRDLVPLVAGGLVYARGQGGNVRAIDAATGRDRLNFAAGDKATGPTVAGGVIVVFDGDGTLYALDAATGKSRWTRPADIGPNDRPAVMAGRVYAGGGDGLVGFDLASGRVSFRMEDKDFPGELAPYIHGIVGLNGVLYCSVGSKKVYAIRPVME